MGIGGGQSYTFNGGMELVVSGTAVAPQNASVDGREMNTQAVLIDGVAMQRLILVTDAEMTITVVTRTNSGADGNLQFPATSRGDTTLNTADVVFMTSDGAVNSDTRTMIALAHSVRSTFGPMYLALAAPQTIPASSPKPSPRHPAQPAACCNSPRKAPIMPMAAPT